MICCYEMRKGRGSCVEPSSLKNFGSMFDAEAIHAQIPSNIEPNYQIDLNVRRNQPQCSNFALNIRTRQSHCGSCRSKGGRCRGTNGNSSYIFSAEKCTFIIKYSKAWKWCRTFRSITINTWLVFTTQAIEEPGTMSAPLLLHSWDRRPALLTRWCIVATGLRTCSLARVRFGPQEIHRGLQ